MARSKALSDKNKIIDAAFSLVDEEGVEALSIRRLANVVGVSSMTLYNYVRNVEDIHREILVRSFNLLLEEIHTIMQAENWEDRSGLAIFAHAYARALFKFATNHRYICSFLIGKGFTNFRNDAELRPFYNMFEDFLSLSDETEGERNKYVYWMYECAVQSLIHEYINDLRPITLEVFLCCVDMYIKNMFPNGGKVS